ncbi:MAG: SGNH/GDSL hydrolase family protein, partial [Pirellulaceae bacterium]
MRKKFIFALLVTGCFFLVLEILLALAGISPLIDQQDPLVGFAESLPLFVEDEENPTRLVTATNKLAYFNPQSFPATKAAGTRRIFCLGGSTTHGRPYDDRTSFAGWLREFLPLADPAQHWEVINAGGVSYASYRVAAVSEQLLDLEPDLLIIYTGHNEFLEELSYPELKNRSRLVKQATLLAARSRVFTLLFKGLKTISGSRGQPTMLGSEVDEILNHTV